MRTAGKLALKKLNKTQRRMVEENLPLAYDIANKFAEKAKGLTLDDLRHEAVLGLIDGAKRHDPKVGRFATGAYWWIQRAIRLALKMQSKGIKIPSNLFGPIARYKETARQMSMVLDRTPTPTEVFKFLKIKKPKEIAEMEHAVQAIAVLNVKAVTAKTERRISPNTSNVSAFVHDDHIAKTIHRFLGDLSPMQGRVICYRYAIQHPTLNPDGVGPLTFNEIAPLIDKTKQGAQVIEDAALTRLRGLAMTNKKAVETCLT